MDVLDVVELVFAVLKMVEGDELIEEGETLTDELSEELRFEHVEEMGDGGR